MNRMLGARALDKAVQSDGRTLTAVAQPFSGPAEDDGSITFHEALKIFRRRRATIFVSAAVLSALGIAWTVSVVPQYSADATVLVVRHQPVLADPQAGPAAVAQPDPVMIQDQVSILQSRAIAERVAKQLDLQNYAEFNPALRPPVWYSRDKILALLPDWLRIKLLPEDAKRELSPAEIEAKTLDDVMARLQDKTKISNDGRSDIITIRSESDSPKLAASIANAYVNAYLVDQLEAKYDDTKRVTNWLDERLGDLRDRVRDSEHAVEAYKNSNKLQVINGTTVTQQQITDLTAQLAVASGDRAQKEANLAQVQKMLRQPGGAEAAGQVLTSNTIQNLQMQEAEIRRKQAELSQTYGPQYPMMIGLATQLNDIHRKIQEEAGKIVQSMEADVAAARSREQSLQLRLQELQNAAAKQGSAEVQLKQLEADALANQTLYQNVLSRFKLSSTQQGLQEAEARLVAGARVPDEPSFPRFSLMVPIIVLVSFVLGILIALIQELLDSGFRSAEQIEQQLGAPLLGMLPDLGRSRRPTDVVVANPTSGYAEALRSLSTSLRYSAGRNSPKIVVITSSVPQEGKTQLATSFARSAAMSGSRVLLIECDFRRPRIRKILNVPGRADLMQLFQGRVQLPDVIARDEETGLEFIAASVTDRRPQDVFESKQMAEFLSSMSSQYDLVVLDTPPVMAVSDAVGLSSLADVTLFVVQYEKTPRKVALNAMKMLRGSGAVIGGVVLSRTNMRKHARYSFGDYGYYFARYGKYYERRPAKQAV